MKKRLPAALLSMSLTLALLTITALAAGHSFVRMSDEPDADWVCSECGGVITDNLKAGYDAALSLDWETLPLGVGQTRGAIRSYVEQLAQDTLDQAGRYMGTVDEVGYTAPDGGRDGSYRYTVTVRSYLRSSPVLADITTPTLTLTVPALASAPTAPVRPSATPSQTWSAGGGWTSSPAPGYVQPSSTIYPYGWGWTTNNYQDNGKSPEVQRQENLAKLLWYAWISRNHSTMPFTDVSRDSWYYPGVSHVWFNSLMSGVSEDRFAPDEPASRAMVWTVLARMRGVAVTPGEGQAWYEPGTAWAVWWGLDDGTDPLGGVTREYLAVMLWKCAGGPITPADLSGYSDRSSVSGYASNGVQWAVAKGLLQGSDGRLSPQGSVTRAELANLVMRFQMM